MGSNGRLLLGGELIAQFVSLTVRLEPRPSNTQRETFRVSLLEMKKKIYTQANAEDKSSYLLYVSPLNSA